MKQANKNSTLLKLNNKIFIKNNLVYKSVHNKCTKHEKYFNSIFCKTSMFKTSYEGQSAAEDKRENLQENIKLNKCYTFVLRKLRNNVTRIIQLFVQLLNY